MQAIKNLIFASVIAFVLIGSPVTQAQDQPLEQSLEALATSLDEWQDAQAQVRAETKMLQERKLKLLETDVEEKRTEVTRRDKFEQDVREKMTDAELAKCEVWIEARRVRNDSEISLSNSKYDEARHINIMLSYAMDAEEEINSLTEKLSDVLTQLAQMLNQSEQ